jgi:outer membrane protein assembly factor BamA
LNRERRWNWGGVAEVQPSLRRLPRTRLTNQQTGPAVTRETQYFERTQVKLAGQASYPLNHAQRLEFETGVRYVDYRLTVSSLVRSLTNGRVLSRGTEQGAAGEPATMGETSAAFVRDTAVFGPTSPVLGDRLRFEIASTFGELSVTRVLLDHRRYLMPVKPYTVATRIVHLGQYGPDAHDVRVLPTFLGSRQFVRGYGWGSLRCQVDDQGECGALEELLGSRLLVGNVEVRAPLLGIRSRELRYGPVPVEGFLFADSGLVWARSAAFTVAAGERRLVGSFGMGARINAFGIPLDIAAVRAMSAPARGWSFEVSFRPGF